MGWIGTGETLTELYVLYSLAGFGAAMVYCGSTTVGLKWFPDKLGLASGLIAAGFGSGAALFIFVIAYRDSRRRITARLSFTPASRRAVIILRRAVSDQPGSR